MEGEALTVFSYAQLRESLPEGVDPRHKERHLSETEFASVFGLTQQEFRCLPDAEQTAKKEAASLV